MAKIESLSEVQKQVILKSTLFPNPNEGAFKLRFKTKLEDNKLEIGIFDITGRKLVSEKLRVSDENTINYKSSLLNGTYLVKVIFADGSHDLHRLIISE